MIDIIEGFARAAEVLAQGLGATGLLGKPMKNPKAPPPFKPYDQKCVDVCTDYIGRSCGFNPGQDGFNKGAAHELCVATSGLYNLSCGGNGLRPLHGERVAKERLKHNRDQICQEVQLPVPQEEPEAAPAEEKAAEKIMLPLSGIGEAVASAESGGINWGDIGGKLAALGTVLYVGAKTGAAGGGGFGSLFGGAGAVPGAAIGAAGGAVTGALLFYFSSDSSEEESTDS